MVTFIILQVLLGIVGLVSSQTTKNPVQEHTSTLSGNFSSPSPLESLVDTRFKQLAAGFQNQIDELKTKVVKLEVQKSEESRPVGVKKDPEMQKQETAAKNKTVPLVCENSSSFCTYFHPDHPDARKKATNYSPIVTNNETIQEMPMSCKDLQLLGHTLSGFYQVKIPSKNQETKTETVYCNFRLSSYLNKGFETRVGAADATSPVHFHVERKKEYYGDNIGEKIKFNKEILNVGNGFDWKNQRFVAPYTGIYFFSISGSKEWEQGSRVSIQVKLNGQEIGEALSSHGSNFGGFSCQLSRKLNASDKIELIRGHDLFYLLYFTGWMVERMQD